MQAEVGRWACQKCSNIIVAAGQLTLTFRGTGAFSGPCPWECGAWIDRGFRRIKPGRVQVYRAAEWDSRTSGPA
jgi:hypothetical protein